MYKHENQIPLQLVIELTAALKKHVKNFRTEWYIIKWSKSAETELNTMIHIFYSNDIEFIS